MKRLMTRARWTVVFVGILSLLVVVLPGFIQAGLAQSSVEESEEQVWQEIARCLPQTPALTSSENNNASYQFELIGTVAETNAEALYNHYHTVNVLSPWEQYDYPWQSLVAVDNQGRCHNLIPERSSGSLTALIPWESAQQLALLNWQYLSQSELGREQIEGVTTLAAEEDGMMLYDDETDIYPEDAWALSQLGYEIDPRLTVLPVETPPMRQP